MITRTMAMRTMPDMRTIPDTVIMIRKRRPQTTMAMDMRTRMTGTVIMNRKLSPRIQIMCKTMGMEEQET